MTRSYRLHDDISQLELIIFRVFFLILDFI